MSTGASPQVRYHSWTDKNAPESYWKHVGAVAAFIAARLNYKRPPCNGGGPRVSTIYVAQHKEKFGSVHVYCTLADSELVQEAWSALDEPSPEFVRKCLLHDAQHYRKVYLEAVELLPHYNKMITDTADYYVLVLSGKEELDAYLDAKDASGVKRAEHKFLHVRFNVESESELRKFLYEAYCIKQ